MRMAQHAGARVLLVGNIDQGGVFGAFVGTMETLGEWERELVAGFVINRFRGIKELLADGLTYLQTTTGKPVLGVVPYLANLALPEEDSLEFKSGALNDYTPLGNRIDIALIDTPRISNFTDVDALRIEDDVRVRQVRTVDELGNPDVIILAGSKNVVSDLQHLEDSGLSVRILEFAKTGSTEIVGICGGYQMLGERLLDPHHIETQHDFYAGLGLLPLETRLESAKILSQTRGRHLNSKMPVQGYEIHHGNTHALRPLGISFERDDGFVLGHHNKSGEVWGTYLHGVFDNDGFRRWFIDKIRDRKGMQKIGKIQKHYTFETSLDRLADSVRSSLDMKIIYQWLGL
ncbi:MAG: cobyric acid synthase, partial [Bdellovibrionia bacterium]